MNKEVEEQELQGDRSLRLGYNSKLVDDMDVAETTYTSDHEQEHTQSEDDD